MHKRPALKTVAFVALVSVLILAVVAQQYAIWGLENQPTQPGPPAEFFPFKDSVNIILVHGGQVVLNETTHNIITNAGEDVISRQTACGATSAPACANGGIYIALTTDTVTPAATDTTLTSEQTLNGLARALGTYAHTAGATTHTIKNTFTYTGSTSVVIAKVGLFDASTAGNMMAETLLSTTATVSANGDQLTITWTLSH